MHTTEDFTIEQIQKHLRIEEETRIRDKKMFEPSSSKVNYVDSNNLSGGGNKRKFSDSSPSNNSNNKQNKTSNKCGKKGHFKRECRNKKKQKKDHKVPNNANMVKENSDIVAMVSNLHISMVFELNMADAKSKSLDWWYDTGATVHVCNNKSHFKSLEDAMVEQQVQMGNNDNTKVEGKGTVELQFISGN